MQTHHSRQAVLELVYKQRGQAVRSVVASETLNTAFKTRADVSGLPEGVPPLLLSAFLGSFLEEGGVAAGFSKSWSSILALLT